MSGWSRARRGFALPAVLWVIVGVAAVSLVGTVAARDAVAAAQNRVDHLRAAWRAEGCLEIARATITEGLADGDHAPIAWTGLDSLLNRSVLLRGTGCDIAAHPSGGALDVNAASAEQLQRLFLAAGARQSEADSLTGALLDWRDRDEEPRPTGAEQSWYRTRGELPPRDGPIGDVAELQRIRGMRDLPGIDTLLGVDPGRIPLTRAPLAVIASLPGIGDEAIARVTEMRLRGEQPRDLLALAASLSREARAEMLARYPELVGLVTIEPDAWIVASTTKEGPRAVSATIEVRLVRAGTRAAIVRRRNW